VPEGRSWAAIDNGLNQSRGMEEAREEVRGVGQPNLNPGVEIRTSIKDTPSILDFLDYI
jgi:hypothetical protein